MSDTVLYYSAQQARKYGFGVKLMFLYFMNIVDWFCTQTLIDSGYFHEANPFMAWIMQYPIVGFFIKCVLPLALSIIIWLIYKIFKVEQNRVTDSVIYIGVGIYSVVLIVHIINFLYLYSV